MVMNDYEKEQWNAICKWKKQEPGVISNAIDMVMKPFSWILNKIIPSAVIRGALTGFNGLAKLLADKGDILRDGNVSSIEELKHKKLKLCDQLADSVHNWALGVAAVEGAGAGFVGLPGLVVDIPSLITLSLRTVHKIGLCYGYECNSEEEKMFIFQILSAAGSNTMQEKTAAILYMKQLQVLISKTAFKKMGEKAAANKMSQEALVVAVRALGKQLGINVTRRKALAAIPILGGGVSAAMNTAFIGDVAWAARRIYQERWLNDNNMIQDNI